MKNTDVRFDGVAIAADVFATKIASDAGSVCQRSEGCNVTSDKTSHGLHVA